MLLKLKRREFIFTESMHFQGTVERIFKEDSLLGRIIVRLSFKQIKVENCSNESVFWKVL